MPPLRVALADDDQLCATLAAARFRRQPGRYTLVATATSATAARTAFPAARPDIVIVDWLLGDGSGLDLVRHFARELPGAACLVVSAFPCLDLIEQANEACAYGLLDKRAVASEELFAALDTVAAGRPYFCARTTALVQTLARQPAAARLSPRHRAILTLLDHHFSHAEIAEKLDLSPRTVSHQVGDIAHRLGLPEAPSLGCLLAAARAREEIPANPTAALLA